MKNAVVHDALRQIQDIVAEEVGQSLPIQARSRVETVLRGVMGGAAAPPSEPVAREVSILLADLRGFTALSAAHPGQTVLALLNRCFGDMSEVVFRHGGTIDKFMGDAMLAIFESGDIEDSARRAVCCAVDMQIAMEALNAAHRATKLPELYLGIGVNSGPVIAARVGSDRYSEYTIIGEEVNLVARIESFSLRGQILVSESTYDLCKDLVQVGEPMDAFVKGKSKVVALREVLAIPSLGKSVPRQEMRRSARVQVKLPVTFRMVSNQAVIPQARWGRILDIGYHGVLAEVWMPLERFAELVLDFDLPLVGDRMNDIYGRVVNAASHGDRTHVGIEFTSMRAEQRAAIQLFVQLLIQGSETED